MRRTERRRRCNFSFGSPLYGGASKNRRERRLRGGAAGRQYLRVLLRISSVEQWSDLSRIPDFRSRRFKRLEGDRQADYSIRLTRSWRLIVRPGTVATEIEIRSVENHYGD